MALFPGLQELALELLGAMGSVRARRMFGGTGIYLDGHFMALIANGVLYLKADASARPAFVAAGCQPFCVDAAGKRVVMGYWSAPEQAMESPALMRPWALLALDSALRAAAAKRPAARRKPNASQPRPPAKASKRGA